MQIQKKETICVKCPGAKQCFINSSKEFPIEGDVKMSSAQMCNSSSSCLWEISDIEFMGAVVVLGILNSLQTKLGQTVLSCHQIIFYFRKEQLECL